jgi:hypothetical protein
MTEIHEQLGNFAAVTISQNLIVGDSRCAENALVHPKKGDFRPPFEIADTLFYEIVTAAKLPNCS